MRDKNSLNKVILIGHLGVNPELRYLPQSERAVAKFSVATNERGFNPNTNETQDRTEWHRIVAWGKLAEFCEKFLSQGKQVCIEGKLRTRQWQDKDGNNRRTTEIEARNIVFLGKKEDTESTDSQSSSPQYTSPKENNMTQQQPEEEEDDDVPF